MSSHLYPLIPTYIQGSSTKFHTVFVTQNMIFNFANFFNNLFKNKVIINTNKEKFFVTKYKVFEYSAQHCDELWVTEAMQFLANLTKFKILKHRSSTYCYQPVNKVYTNNIPVNSAKYKEVINLVHKCDLRFCNALSENQTVRESSSNQVT